MADSNLQAVIFDFGEVLSLPPSEQHFRSMAHLAGLPPQRFDQLYWQRRLEYDADELNVEEYWSWLLRQASHAPTHELIAALDAEDTANWLRTNPDMIEWVTSLRARGIKAAILSNMPRSLMEAMRRRLGWLSRLDFLTFSCELGIVKPAPEIYRHTLAGLGVAAEAALFLDDKAVNVEAARALGMRSVVFRSLAQLDRDLAEMGLSQWRAPLATEK